MKLSALRLTSLMLFALTGVWLCLCCGTSCSEAQLSALVWNGRHPLLDWNILRLPAEFSNCYSCADLPEVFPGAGPIPSADVCNPPLAYALARLLPASFCGGIFATCLGAFCYLAASAFFLVRRKVSSVPLAVAALSVSIPFLFAVQVGNDILFAAAAALVFLALYDADSRLAQTVAAVSIAFAFAIKVSPVALGALYFGRGFRRRLPFAALSALLGVAFLLVPFAWYQGADGFCNWLSCAAANSATYEFRNVIGLYGAFFELGRIFDVAEGWHAAVGGIVHACSALFAFALLLIAAFGSRPSCPTRLFLTVAGMLMLPPTMMIYTLLYVMPVLFLLDGKLAPWTFVALANPLMVFIGGGSLTPLFSAAMFLLLAISIFVRHSIFEKSVECDFILLNI